MSPSSRLTAKESSKDFKSMSNVPSISLELSSTISISIDSESSVTPDIREAPILFDQAVLNLHH